ncbi:MAG: hypothetical protein A3K19_16305 [Lentisphaerae bacterium RIFOXYB12_FULL_65_16]|nr:MAG: hypothetical protein A3K18_20610 [Lentisphaerae bacterium RIFOXYA12_64_32]OGV84496.1 MAG: hypothetical protein A3K19_16305 [Lentisphaerae bacterium RIFOXYB12_FULL_65_16]
MNRFASLTVLGTILLGFSVHAEELQLPPPPKGYSWERCEEIKGAFLRPDGWNFLKSKKGDTQGYFITKEPAGEGKQFTTGLTVNVITDIPRKKSVTPYRYAQIFRESARKTEKFTSEWDKAMGPFQSVGFVYIKTDKSGSRTVHNLLIANDKTGTLYLVMFEAPADEWDAAWTTGEPILKLLYIDDTI